MPQDEYGIEIKSAPSQVDEFGIPIKKKDGISPSSNGQVPSTNGGNGSAKSTNGTPSEDSGLISNPSDVFNVNSVIQRPPSAIEEDRKALAGLNEFELAQKAELPKIIPKPEDAQNFGMASVKDIQRAQTLPADNTTSTQVEQTLLGQDAALHGAEHQKAAKEKLDHAIENTADNFFKGKVAKDSPQFEQKKVELIAAHEAGDVSVALKDGKPGLKRNKGFLEGLSNGWNAAKLNEEETDKFVNQMTVQERVDYVNKLPEPAKDSGYIGERNSVGGSLGEFSGGALPYLAKVGAGAAIAAGAVAFAPETMGASLVGLSEALPFLFSAPDLMNQGAKGEILRRYEIEKQAFPDKTDVENMQRAGQGTIAGGIGGLLTAAVFTGGMPSALKAGGAIPQASKDIIVKAAGGTIKAGFEVGAQTAAIDLAVGAEANLEGIKTSPEELVQHAVGVAVENANTVMLLHGLTMAAHGAIALPKVVKNAFKYGVKDMPPADVQELLNANEAAGTIPKGTATEVIQDLNAFRDALQKIPPDLNEETKASVAGLIQKRDALIKEQETKDDAFKGTYQIKVDEINNQIGEIVKTNKPFDHEVDDVTGDPLKNPIATDTQNQNTNQNENVQNQAVNINDPSQAIQKDQNGQSGSDVPGQQVSPTQKEEVAPLADLLKVHENNPALTGMKSDAEKVKYIAEQAQNVQSDGSVSTIRTSDQAYESAVKAFDKPLVDAAIKEHPLESLIATPDTKSEVSTPSVKDVNQNDKVDNTHVDENGKVIVDNGTDYGQGHPSLETNRVSEFGAKDLPAIEKIKWGLWRRDLIQKELKNLRGEQTNNKGVKWANDNARTMKSGKVKELLAQRKVLDEYIQKQLPSGYDTKASDWIKYTDAEKTKLVEEGVLPKSAIEKLTKTKPTTTSPENKADVTNVSEGKGEDKLKQNEKGKTDNEQSVQGVNSELGKGKVVINSPESSRGIGKTVSEGKSPEITKLEKQKEDILKEKNKSKKSENVNTSKPNVENVKVSKGKYATKAKEVADKIRSAEIPQWLVNTDPTIKKSGITGESIKNVFADAVEHVGELLDKGVEFKDAVKEGANKIIDHLLSDYPKGSKLKEGYEKQIRDGFENHYKENILKAIPKEGNKLSLQQIKEDANSIITGDKVFERFSQEEQRGIAAGGEIHAEASIILGRNEGAGGEPEAQEQAIESYAKEKGVWVDNTDTTLREEHGKPLSELDTDKNHEATVWRKDASTVIKSQNTAMYGFDVQQKLDGITLQNTYFPEAPVKVIGFGRAKNGDFQVIVEQPFIQRHPDLKVTEAEITNHLNKIGFNQHPENDLFTDGKTIIEDVHTQNAIKTPEGNIIVIDPIMRLNTKEQGYGGERISSNKINEKPKTSEKQASQGAQGEAQSQKAKNSEGDPPTKPPEVANSTSVIQPRTILSHKGLQEIASQWGLNDITARERKSDLKLLKDAEGTINKWVDEGSYGENIKNLIETSESAIPLTDEQRVILEQHIANVRAETAKVLEESGINSPAYDKKIKELQRLTSAGAKTRSAAGAALRIPNSSLNPMASLGDAMIAKMEANKSDTLTEGQKAEVEAQYKKYEEANADLENKWKAAEDKNTELTAENELLKAKKEKKPSSKSSAPKTHDDYVNDRKSLIEKLKEQKAKHEQWLKDKGIQKQGFGGFTLTGEMAKTIGEIVKSHLEEVGAKLADVTRKTFEDVKDLFPGIEEKDIHDVIAGEYNAKKPTRTELQVRWRDLQTEASLLNKYESILKGEPKTENQRQDKNRRLTEIRKQIAELQKEEKDANNFSPEDVPDEVKKAQGLIKRNKEQVAKIKERIDNKDFEPTSKPKSFLQNAEFKKKYPELYKQALDSYTAKEDAKHEFDIAIFRDSLKGRDFVEKTTDYTSKAIGTVKALVTGIDDSAIAIQTFVSLLVRPIVGAQALREHALDAFSQKRFDRGLAELHNSEDYPEMQAVDLHVTEPKSLTAEKKEEIFNNRFSGTIKVNGKEYKLIDAPLKPFERAFTSLGNAARVIAYRNFAKKYHAEGHTFENNPELFKSLARRLNEQTGRGKENEYIKKASELVTLGIWSPKLMASKINILGLSDLASLTPLSKAGTKGFYRTLHPIERRQAYIDVATFMAASVGLSYLTAWSFGGDLDIHPDSSTFMDIQFPNGKSYNLTGGFSGYIRTVVQVLRGGKRSDGVFHKYNSMFADRASEAAHFMRGKTPPITGAIISAGSGKDYLGNATTWSAEGLKLLSPISVKGIATQLERDGSSSLFAQGLPTFVGINVKDKRDYDISQMSKEDVLKKVFNNNDIDITKIRNYKQNGRPISENEGRIYQQRRDAEITKNIEAIYQKGIPVIDDNGRVTVKPFKELTNEEIVKEKTYIKTLATKEIKEKMFGKDKKTKLETREEDRLSKARHKLYN